MSLVDLITGKRSQAFLSAGLNDVVLDAVISLSESDNSNVSFHAIENGANVEDHINKMPKSLVISAILTDDDWSLTDPTQFADKTIDDRLDILEIWQEYAEILTYYGHEKDIEDLVLTNVSRNKNLDTGAGIGLDLSLQQINIAESTEVAISPSLSAENKKGATPKGTSEQAGNVSTSKAETMSSFIYDLVTGGQ